MAAWAGADLVGVVGPMPSGPGTLDLDKCRWIADRCPDCVTPVLLTSSETAEDISSDVERTGVSVVQLVRHVPPKVHRTLDTLLPQVQRIQVLHVENDGVLDLIPVYQDCVAAFLLDSGRIGADELGGTGRVHDWRTSRDFVKASPLPVYLAGGLTPENAAEAAAMVRPYGLDVCSGLRTNDALDVAKLSAFVAALGGKDQAS